MALDAAGHRLHDHVRGCPLTEAAPARAVTPPTRLPYLDWLRGVAVLVMIESHVLDSWTRAADRQTEPYYTLQWSGGVASALFLLLAGAAMAMSAASKARQSGSVDIGARAARRRGWEILLLAFVFRLQSQLLGLGPLYNFFKVDMLNMMGVSMVIASCLWQLSTTRRRRLIVFASVTTAITLVTPFVRAVPWLAPLPDPIEAYLRPAGPYSAFPFFPWAGFLFAGVIVGELVDAVRLSGRRAWPLHASLAMAGISGVVLGWLASLQPALYPTADFWHDSPTLFFIRLGAATTLVPFAWVVERLSGAIDRVSETLFAAIVTLGRSSLFVYWIHVEMVYGVIAEPLKKALPLWGSLTGWVLMCVAMYYITLWKNRLVARRHVPRVFAAVLR